MSYTPPSLNTLYDVTSLDEEYKRNNPVRKELLHRVKWTKLIVEEEDNIEALDIMVGAYLYGYVSCDNYKFFSPTFKRGILFDTGSTCYTALKNKLNINKDNPISQYEILIYLSKFYHFVKTHLKSYEGFIEKPDLFFKDVKQMLKKIFNKNKHDILRVLKAIPSEEALDEAIKKFEQAYLERAKSNNCDRKLHIQLLQALNKALPIKLDEDDDVVDFIPRRQRVKMGYLIYLMHHIDDSYFIRSPKGNSVAYDLSCNALNVESLREVDQGIQFACLAAFKCLLNDFRYLTKLENQFKHDRISAKQPTIYIDTLTYEINKKCDVILEKLKPHSHCFEFSNFTLACITVASLCAAVPGYGLGYVAGLGLGLTDPMVSIKQSLSTVTDFGMRVMFGKNGSYITYLPSEMILDATLERGFAKVFEALAILLGGAVGAAFAFTIKEVTYETLKSLCLFYMKLHDDLCPKLAKDVDLTYLNCLMAIPEEFFPNDKKQKIKTMIEFQNLKEEKMEITINSPLLKY